MHLLKYYSLISFFISCVIFSPSFAEKPQFLSYEASLELGQPAHVNTTNTKFIHINGTHHIKEINTVIPKGTTWIVGPGATIFVPNEGSITVEGNIQVRGSKSRPVTIKSNNGAWYGIKIKGDLEGNLNLLEEIGSSFSRDYLNINLLSNTIIKNIKNNSFAIELIAAPLLAYNLTATDIDLIKSRTSIFFLVQSTIGCGSHNLLDLTDSRAVLINSKLGSQNQKCLGDGLKLSNSNIGLIASQITNFNTSVSTYSSKMVIFNSTIGANEKALSLNSTLFSITNSIVGSGETPIDFRPGNIGIISNSKIIFPNKKRCPIKASASFDLFVDNLDGWNGCIKTSYVFDFNELRMNKAEKVETAKVNKWIQSLPYLPYPKWKADFPSDSDEDYANAMLEEVVQSKKIKSLEQKIVAKKFGIIPKNDVLRVCLKKDGKSYLLENYRNTLDSYLISFSKYIERECAYQPIIPNNVPKLMVDKAKDIIKSFNLKL